MTLRKQSEAMKKVTANIFEADWAWLQATYVKSGASNALRKILRAHRRNVEKLQKEAKGQLDVEVEIDL